ncbi:hypothetical protein [Pelotalea chapellei]|uniref:Uncharacterized protein n=1 Tax=Pelotalea chapellei TaxID=44671 RepID=A0ABS5UCN0_9BACT|nr:hypothetical protein [Pelotalea chapellei]MBT1073459.1 hypothetical protein [Pelotalea chapellei]
MALSSETIDHVTLQHLVEAGAVKAADVVGQPGGWGIVIKYGMVERALAARRGAIRTFSRFETLVSYLKEIGISQFFVNASNYDPTNKKTHRPDSAVRMKRTFDAAEHDKWFRDQVEEGIRQADDPNAVWVSNEEVEARGAQRRAAWTKQAKERVA